MGRFLNKLPTRPNPQRKRIGKAASHNKGEIFLNIIPNIGICPSASSPPSFFPFSLRLEKNKEEIIKNAQQTYFNDKYSKYLKDIDVDFNDDQAKKIKLSTDENVKAVNLMTVYNTISKELNKK